MDEAIFLVSEDEAGVQGFTCVNHQTGYVWRSSSLMRRRGAGTERRSLMRQWLDCGPQGIVNRS